MSTIPLLSSSPRYSEASQVIPTINGVIQSINSNVLIGSVAPSSFRNTVIGGDFATNPWQRGTSFLAITNTLTYTADRFWALGGASSSISVTQQTSGAPPGFPTVLQFGRASGNTDTTAIKLGYVMTSADSIPYQGVPFILSFYAKAGATYSSASSIAGISVGYGTDTDGTAANFASGSWTGFTTVNLTGSAGTQVTSVTLTTSWARYVVAGFIPTTATQIGFNLQFTPVGTAGSTDNFQITGVQFEQSPLGGVAATPFERRSRGLELLLCQRYYFQLSEGANATLMGATTGTQAARITVPLPTTMRATPVPSYPTASGNWALLAATGTTTGTITATVNVTGASTPPSILVTTIAVTLTAASPVWLTSTATGTEPFKFSAEL